MCDRKNKTFQIEAFKHNKELEDRNYAEEIWKTLEDAFHQILICNVSPTLNFEELYRNAYSMVLHGHGEKLYSGLVTTITAQLKETSNSMGATQGEPFLEELNRKWTNHNKALQMIQDIVMYMDRTFVISTHKTPVHKLGLNLWRDDVIRSSNIHTRLLSTLLGLIQTERTTEEVMNRELLRNTTKMLIDLGSSVYQEDFEKPFLEASSVYYQVKSQELIECCDCSEYLKKVEGCLSEERARVSSYLDPQTEVKIANVVKEEMIGNYMVRLVHKENSGLVKMLHDDEYEDLGRMYNLLSKVEDGVTIIQDVMTSHIEERLTRLVTDRGSVKDLAEFQQLLADEREKFDKIVSLAFNDDKTFKDALDFSFEAFLDLDPRSS